MTSRNFFLNPKMGTDLLLAASGEKVRGNDYCFPVLNSQKDKCIKSAHFFTYSSQLLELNPNCTPNDCCNSVGFYRLVDIQLQTMYGISCKPVI
jgi:hypothetical protein